MIHSLPRFWFFVLSCLSFFCIRQSKAQGIILPASGTYTQTFDNLSAGLPEGWTVRTGAFNTFPRLGTVMALPSAPATWSDASAGYKNLASADQLSASATDAQQAASADRALGIRQSDTFGNPGAAFTLQIANTLGASDLKLKCKLQSLDASATRATTWHIEYGLGVNPAIYFPMGSSFTTGANAFGSQEITVNFGWFLNNNQGPIWIRLIADTPASGTASYPLTAIDDVSLTYSTSNFVTVNRVNTLTYSVGAGPATTEGSFQVHYPAGAPSSLTVVSNSPAKFSVSSDGVNFGSSAIIAYTSSELVTATVTFRLVSGLPVGTYRGLWSILGGGLASNISYFVNGLVTASPNQPTVSVTPTSLTGTNGFTYNLGNGPSFKYLDLIAANLTGAPGSLTFTSSNPSVFQFIDYEGQRNSRAIQPYSTSNDGSFFISVLMAEGLAAGDYNGTVTITGGGITPITIPVSGKVTTDNPPTLSLEPTSLSDFSTTLGTPSAPQTFTVTGRNFSSVQVGLGVPNGFELAASNSPAFSSNIAIGASGNFAVEVKVRMKGDTAGSFRGNIMAKTGPLTVLLPLSGTVNTQGSGPLSVTALSYNCTTGALTFGRTGGDVNRAVEYMAVGVKSYSTNPNGIIDLAKRNDPNSGTIVTLKARYVGDPASEVSRDFNFGTHCSTPQPPTTDFAITGVNTVSCQRVNGGERRLTFTPQYSGLTGPVSFSVVNEMLPTLSAGPYTLRVYTDNPIITLSAQQGSASARYSYNWLSACNSPARLGFEEGTSRLAVKVLGNPIVGQSAEVEISGVSGQAVQLKLVDLQGKTLHGQSIKQSVSVERVSLSLGNAQGILLLDVSTATQRQQIKLLRP